MYQIHRIHVVYCRVFRILLQYLCLNLCIGPIIKYFCGIDMSMPGIVRKDSHLCVSGLIQIGKLWWTEDGKAAETAVMEGKSAIEAKPELSALSRKGYTTKGKGHGTGLSSYRKIVARCPCCGGSLTRPRRAATCRACCSISPRWAGTCGSCTRS